MDDPPIFFDGWGSIVRTAILTPLAYGALVLFLRAAGKRSIAQLNVFDWVVTVALGSALASVVVTPDVALLPGLLGIGGLIGLQFVVSFLTSRFQGARSLVTAEPTLVVKGGELLQGAMRRERVSESEVLQALRQTGHASLEHVDAIILETNGTFTVLADTPEDPATLEKPMLGG